MQGVPFIPTDDQRRTVKAMAGFGVTQDDIACHLNIDPKTLRLHFRSELDNGTIEANAKVAQSLFQMATQGKNVAAAIFWMKARAGWREKQEVQVTVEQDLDRLSDEELEAVVRQARKDLVDCYDRDQAEAARQQQLAAPFVPVLRDDDAAG